MTALSQSADIPPQGYTVPARLKAALVADLRECGVSRAEVAHRLTLASGRKITEHQVDAWAAPAKEGYRFPAEMIGLWCQVTGSRRVVDVVLECSGLVAMDQTAAGLAEYGRAALRREKLETEVASLRDRLWTKV